MSVVLNIEEICRQIRPADRDITDQVWKIWDNKCIPLRSLEWLQETLVRIAGIQRTIHPQIEKKLTIVMAADNGVISEGVSQSDYHVTTQVVDNMIHHKATVALMADYDRSELLVVDMGTKEKVDGVLDENGKRKKGIGFMPAVELSYIRPKNQRLIAVSMDGEQTSPSVAQAKRLRELDEKNLLNGDVIDQILCEEKKEVDKVIINSTELEKYFGKDKSPREMKDKIISLLDDWKAKQPPELGKPEKKTDLEK